MWNAVDAAFETLVAGCLAGLHEAFYLVLFTFSTCVGKEINIGPAFSYSGPPGN